MAQSYTTSDGIVLIDPGTYVALQVINNQSGIANSGIVTLIGESSAGPYFAEEPDLDANSYGPDQLGAIQQKYGSGRLVDAFRAIVAAANDPQIVGAVNQVVIVKTNPSLAAAAAILRTGFGTYSDLTANSQGAQGNLINYLSAVSIPETPPQTGSFSYVPTYSPTPVISFTMINNGLTSLTDSPTVPNLTSGPEFASAVENYTAGVLAQGANEVDPLVGIGGSPTLAAAVGSNPRQIIITLAAGAFTTIPAAGDTLVIPAASTFGATTASVIAGAGNANVGSYIITDVAAGVSTSTITATLINEPAGFTTVVAVATTPVSSGQLDIITYKPINIQNITGQNRNAISTAPGTYTYVVTGNSVVMTPPVAFTARPQPGDYVTVPLALGTLNAGFYQVVSSTATAMTMTRLSNGTPGTSGATSGTTPFTVSRPVIDGTGKSTEVEGSVAAFSFNSDTLAPQDWGNQLLTSASEYVNSFTVSYNGISNTYISGGDIAVEIGCSQPESTVVVGPTSMTFKVGATTIFTAAYAQYPTLSTLISFINSQTTFTAALGTSSLSNLSPASLDQGTYGIYTSIPGDMPGRIKEDAADFASNLNGDPNVNTTEAASGLPDSIAPAQFLSGGTLAGTTSADFVAAIDACQTVDTNFIVPLVSEDATLDIAEGLTDPSSTYAIDAVNAYIKSHVIFMSSLQQRKNRIAVVSREGTYAQQQAAAENLSSFRVGMTFQDVTVVNSAGVLQTYQSWMGAVIAAGMQAAAGYKGIVKKFANISGISSPEGDFNPMLYSQRVSALESGLLILEKVTTGGFRWVSDQMTYNVDNNFVYNSMQAVYLADLMALTLIQAFDQAIVGKSIAQISAAAALSFLDGQCFNFRRLNWIAPSVDAPKGYKNASVNIIGGAMVITLEVKLAGLIYFVPITLSVSQVEQSASQ
jgi:hypothetical protein